MARRLLGSLFRFRGRTRACARRSNRPISTSPSSARPRGSALTAIRCATRIAELAGIPIERVGVKATTSEKMGFTGRGEGMGRLCQCNRSPSVERLDGSGAGRAGANAARSMPNERPHDCRCRGPAPVAYWQRPLTEIAGSSDVFERGFVTYSNEAKQTMVGVTSAALCKSRGGQPRDRGSHGQRRTGACAGPISPCRSPGSPDQERGAGQARRPRAFCGCIPCRPPDRTRGATTATSAARNVRRASVMRRSTMLHDLAIQQKRPHPVDDRFRPQMGNSWSDSLMAS